jgi:competence protein ComGC
MSVKKRKIKNRFFQQIKLFSLTFVGMLVLFGVVSMLFILLSPKKELFINPLGKSASNRNSQVSDMLQKSNIAFSSIEKRGDSSYVISLKDGGKVVITENKNVQSQISSLQLILSRLTIEGKRFKNLDFRYDKPVVSF